MTVGKASIAGAIVLCASIYSPSAFAADGGFHCPAPGTRIETSVGGHLVGTGGDSGYDCLIKNGTKSFWRHAGFTDRKSDAKFKEAAEKLWPLEVGKEAEVVSVCDGHGVDNAGCYQGARFRNVIKVAGIEDVTVKAGTFKAYRVTISTDSSDDVRLAGGINSQWHSVATHWWVPALGYTVKYSYERKEGASFRGDHEWEAVNVARQQ